MELHLAGYHIDEIINKLKCDSILVYNTVVNNDYITNEQQRNEMINLRNDGHTYSDIGKELKCSAQCVRTRINSSAKINAGTKRYSITDSELKKLKNWYLEGKTFAWISRQLDIPAKAIKWRIKLCGLYKKGYSQSVPLTPKEKRKITSMRKKGYSIGDIAIECGRNYCTISKYLEEFI